MDNVFVKKIKCFLCFLRIFHLALDVAHIKKPQFRGITGFFQLRSSLPSTLCYSALIKQVDSQELYSLLPQIFKCDLLQLFVALQKTMSRFFEEQPLEITMIQKIVIRSNFFIISEPFLSIWRKISRSTSCFSNELSHQTHEDSY